MGCRVEKAASKIAYAAQIGTDIMGLIHLKSLVQNDWNKNKINMIAAEALPWKSGGLCAGLAWHSFLSMIILLISLKIPLWIRWN